MGFHAYLVGFEQDGHHLNKLLLQRDFFSVPPRLKTNVHHSRKILSATDFASCLRCRLFVVTLCLLRLVRREHFIQERETWALYTVVHYLNGATLDYIRH